MSDEQDSFISNVFGVDVGAAANKLREEASAALGQVTSTVSSAVQTVQSTVEGAVEGVSGAVGGVVKKIAGAVAPSGSSSAGSSGASGGTGSFPLGGSVGRGGKNAPGDVRAVQAALGIAADGQCGGGTIAAIEAFQRTLGQGKPDGRVDAGGGTERNLAGGPRAAASASSTVGGEDPSTGPFDGALQGVKAFGTQLLAEANADADGAKVFGGALLDDASKALEDPNIASNQVRPPDASAPDASAPDAGAPGAGAPDAGTGPDPTFEDIDRPFNVRADDPAEFINKGNDYLGKGIAGHMKTETLTIKNAVTDAKGGVLRANLVVRTTTERPRWVAGRTIGDERAVIEQAEELIRGHEERHRDIMKEGMTNAVKEMRGKSKAEAEVILEKWVKIVDTRQDALDVREGKIQIVQSAGRMTGAKLVPR